jgi:8-oxo-dGTP pyrophosphatase MutT (NUDIX family)
VDWIPHITVAAVVETKQDFLLVEEYSDGNVVFNQPAGHWDAGETLIDAVIRETLEETAWHFVPQAIVGIYTYTSEINHITYLRLCFCGTVTTHETERSLDTGVMRAVWLNHAAIVASQKLRSPMVLQCIDDYLAGIRYPLSLLTAM